MSRSSASPARTHPPSKVTDCEDGQVFIGSDTRDGTMVALKWMPRALSGSELKVMMSFGKTLDDLL